MSSQFQMKPFLDSKTLCGQRHLNEMTHPLIHWQDQTSKGRSFQLASCQPPLSAQRTKSMVAHANQCFLGSTWQRGNIKRSALGECSLIGRTLEWKLRMKVCFHHKFVVNERMESAHKFDSPNDNWIPKGKNNINLMYCLRVSPIELMTLLKVNNRITVVYEQRRVLSPWLWNRQATSHAHIFAPPNTLILKVPTYQDKNNRVNEMELSKR
jgi:hypothetical protein